MADQRNNQEKLREIRGHAKSIRDELRGSVVYGIAMNEHDDPDVELVAAYCLGLMKAEAAAKKKLYESVA